MSSTSERTDIHDRADVERLVRAFYREVATDDLLGPIFAHADVDWPEHVELLTRFWCTQLLDERSYEGNPLRAHRPLHAAMPFTDEHFGRWLDLFLTTVDDHFAGVTADLAMARARGIAQTMQRLLDRDARLAVPGPDDVDVAGDGGGEVAAGLTIGRRRR